MADLETAMTKDGRGTGSRTHDELDSHITIAVWMQREATPCVWGR